MEKKSFILYNDYFDHISRLSDEEAGKLFKAIFMYSADGTAPELPPMADMAMSFIASQMKRDKAKYAETCKRRSAAGRKGAAVTNSRRSANAVFAAAKAADNVTVTETDTVNVNESENVTETDNVTENENVTVTENGTDNAYENVSVCDNEKENERKRDASRQHTHTPENKPEIRSSEGGAAKPERKRRGKYGNILLSEAEFAALCRDYSKEKVNEYIDRMDCWVQMNSSHAYRDYDAALRHWLIKDGVPAVQRDTKYDFLINNF